MEPESHTDKAQRPCLLEALTVEILQAILVSLNTRGARERAIQRYEFLLRSGSGEALAKELGSDKLVELVRLNSNVQFFVNDYVEFRLPEIRKRCPDAASPLTARERTRIAKALLWHLTLGRIDSLSRYDPSKAVSDMFLDLFQPYEKQQIADAHSFFYAMVPLTIDREPYNMLIADLAQFGLRRELSDIDYLRDKLLAWRQVLEAAAPRPEYWIKRDVTKIVAARYNLLRADPLPVQAESHLVAVEVRGLCDTLYQREDALPRLQCDETIGRNYNGVSTDVGPGEGAPFGWVDAHAGIDCQRWGHQVRREVLADGQEDLTTPQRLWSLEKLNEWRCMGFLFWDRARIELLKTHYVDFTTGWLTVAPPPTEECKAHLLSTQPA